MPSLGHLAIGVAAGRFHAPVGRSTVAAMALFSALSCYPDVDAVGFWLGVPYRAPFGHRGAFHSLPVAVVVAVVVAVLLGGLGRSRIRMALTAVAVTVSHGILDAMTSGGAGAALLWPFTTRRFFMPLRPIPVAPIGMRFVSARGLSVFLVELLLFAPFLLYAFWPRVRAEALARDP